MKIRAASWWPLGTFPPRPGHRSLRGRKLHKKITAAANGGRPPRDLSRPRCDRTKFGRGRSWPREAVQEKIRANKISFTSIQIIPPATDGEGPRGWRKSWSNYFCERLRNNRSQVNIHVFCAMYVEICKYFLTITVCRRSTLDRANQRALSQGNVTKVSLPLTPRPALVHTPVIK